jgi:redox-sensing transcriptional repressor
MRNDYQMPSPASVSPLTLHRLSLYLRCLESVRARGIKTVSSQELARRFELSASQIRKDLAHFGELGIRGVGYDVDGLTARLQHLLGLDRQHPTIVVGVGSLGSALIRFLAMSEAAFRVVAAIDNDSAKIGRSVGRVRIGKPENLGAIIADTGAEIGVLTVPASVAQANYDRLVRAGVRGVLNFAPIRLERQPGVLTRSVDLRIFFEELSFRLDPPD